MRRAIGAAVAVVCWQRMVLHTGVHMLVGLVGTVRTREGHEAAGGGAECVEDRWTGEEVAGHVDLGQLCKQGVQLASPACQQ